MGELTRDLDDENLDEFQKVQSELLVYRKFLYRMELL